MGVAVIPIYTRHPVAMAQQALTVNKVLNGNLALGVGASHRVFVERVWGGSFDQPVSYMAEYLEILLLLLEERRAYMRGKRIVMRGELDIEGSACPVMVAALGPRMLELAGRVAAGTITWMAGLRTIKEFTAPAINEAAAAAGRSAPNVVVGLPVCVTDDIDGARARATDLLSKEEQASSYKKLLDREGLSGAGEMCIIGSEASVADQLAAFLEAGATSILAAPTGTSEEIERTWELLASLVR
jgi:F420-dependent oxidoreductase-like protein